MGDREDRRKELFDTINAAANNCRKTLQPQIIELIVGPGGAQVVKLDLDSMGKMIGTYQALQSFVSQIGVQLEGFMGAEELDQFRKRAIDIGKTAGSEDFGLASDVAMADFKRRTVGLD